ncbi:hypothetical protein J8F10_31895 [Gemmata sp. G18]|uniref:Helix-turn-helix domain-containing protein n=1 Tax=Gemmata palustris TaxID=2822762 RepID=A0ABS5C1L3_9BACT|nr:hypothetical protein [Gemmata palustris]MBP3959875.1 hypothetical protein [Gemmata palustris]
MSSNKFHMLGVTALRVGASPHHLFRLAERGQVPHIKVDRFRVFAESDEPAIRAALLAAGYIRDQKTEAASC